jgi:hypothetical protein
VVGRQSYGQGLLFGFGDEAAAGARSLFGEDYTQALEDERKCLRKVQEARPVASTGA